MPAAQTPEEFLKLTSAVPSEIGDEVEAPAPIAGLAPPLDPMKPWLSINVDAYMPMVRFGIKQPYKFAAAKFDPLWALDEEEVEALEPALKEATQKCLYDLNLSSLAGNPYVAAAVALTSLSLGKYAAIQVVRMMEAQKEAEQKNQSNGPRIQPNQPRGVDQPNRVSTQRASSMTSGRTPGFVDVSSSAGFRAPENPNFSSIEFEGDDE